MAFETARQQFLIHYGLFALVASLGTIQLAAARGGLRGLWMAGSARAVRRVGGTLVALAFLGFFLSPLFIAGPWGGGTTDSARRTWGTSGWSTIAEARNVNDIDGGLSGTEQAELLFAGFAIALVVSGLSGARHVRGGHPAAPGIAGLATASLWATAGATWRRSSG